MIAREGIIFIFIGFAITTICIVGAARWNSYWLFGASMLFGILTLFCTFFFRDPDRNVPNGLSAILSPADGKVVQVQVLKAHPYVGENAKQVSIFLSVFDVHVNRIPASGQIDYVKYNAGKFFAAFEDKASELNEQTEVGLLRNDGSRMVFKQIAGLIARRIVCNLHEGQSVAAGDRFGLIRFGSRVDIILPAKSQLLVSLGDRVIGGETAVATLPVTTEMKAEPSPTGGQNGH